MKLATRLTAVTLCLLALPGLLLAQTGGVAEFTIEGARLDPSAVGPSFVEPMSAVLARDRWLPRALPKGHTNEPGEWLVPSLRAISKAHSGEMHVTNNWGDTRMGIGFGRLVRVEGAWFAIQQTRGATAPAIRVLGYRDGLVVAETDWWDKFDFEPSFFAMDLRDVDRIEIIAQPAVNGAAWYALDDLTYIVFDERSGHGQRVVVDFEDLAHGQKLTGSGYAGLDWEIGGGVFPDDAGIPAPEDPRSLDERLGGARGPEDEGSGTRAVLPSLLGTVQGVIRGDAGQSSFPPDTCGAVGPDHAMIVVNTNVSVYNKATGARVINTSLGAFLGPGGDPRVLFDQYSNRWIVISTEFNSGTRRIFLAVSTSADATGTWFKTSFATAVDTDTGRWPDYPTLGYDQNGLYIGAYMVGSPARMTLWAIDKAPLIASTPSLGTVVAFRGLTWEGALQPCITYGTASGAYVASLQGASIRVRRVNFVPGSPSNFTLTEQGFVSIPAYAEPQPAPALGSSTNVDTVGSRLMMAVFRNNSIFTAHTVQVSGRAACRWYQLNPLNMSLVQFGTVADSSLHYYFPSIMVNQYGHLAMGFSGSDANNYIGAYYTGRIATDPPGEMAAPVRYRAGAAPSNFIDNVGRNRWGDYSLTTLDPSNQTDMWTLQAYAHAASTWGTTFAKLTVGGDCNGNGIPDFQDIINGTSLDCNSNGVPDECDLALALSGDCNSNNIPDECDIIAGIETDCNGNLVPDACELIAGAPDCNNNNVPDDCDIATGLDPDCNFNTIPDSCDIAAGTVLDCNNNGVPDSCDVASGSVPDCNNNGIPDSCDLALTAFSVDCNSNGIPDECDVASGVASDCDSNRIPDSCQLNPASKGLAGAYHAQPNLAGTPKGRIDAQVDFDFGTGPAWPGTSADNFSIRWTGYVQAAGFTGAYQFHTLVRGGVRLWVDNQLIINQPANTALAEFTGSLSLQAGQVYALSLEYLSGVGAAQVRLSWTPPGQAKAVIPSANLMPGRDCNGNGNLDACDFLGWFIDESPNYVPLGTGTVHTHTIVAPPDAVGDVTLTFTAFGDLNTDNEFVTALLNGTQVGGNLFIPGFDCAVSTSVVTLAEATYNTLKGGGDVTYTLTPSSGVNPSQCGGNPANTYIRVRTAYLRILSQDQNNNLIPDECEAPAGCPGDMNCDGAVNFDDIDLFVEALGYAGGAGWPYPNCPWTNGDCNGDNDVTFDDIDAFVALIGSSCP